MIPKRIVTSWVGVPGRDIYSDAHRALFLKCFESWRRFLPDYSVTIVTRENLFDHGFDATVKGWYDRGFYVMSWAMPTWLNALGGIYMDMDMEVLKRFDSLHGEECFLGRETDGFVNDAMVGAVQGHPFLVEKLARVKDCDLLEQNEGGPRLCTKILREWGWGGENLTQRVYVGDHVGSASVLVLEDEAIYPFLWDVPFTERRAKITDKTIAVHHWASTWNQTEANQKREDL